jgi:hypothetical protein
MVSAFEGNKAEAKTMLPVIEAFMAAHQLPDVTVVADAGMVSERSSTTSTGLTGPGARCAGSTSRSARPSRPSPGRPR